MIFLLIVTLSSMLVAAIMSVIAWRLAAAERRRSEARIAALSAEIHAPAMAGAGARSVPRRAEIGLRAEPARLTAVPQPRSTPRWDDDLPLRAAEPVRGDTPLFATPEPHGRGRWLFAAAVVGAIAAVVLGAGLLRGGPVPGRATTAPVAPSTDDNQSVGVGQPAPLELVALGHERDGSRLIVRGVVRDRSAGAAAEPLTAVVFVFNADGGFVTSARAAVNATALRSTGESTFAVTVPDAASVSRYRVSFRSGDRIVPHVDRREPVKGS